MKNIHDGKQGYSGDKNVEKEYEAVQGFQLVDLTLGLMIEIHRSL